MTDRKMFVGIAVVALLAVVALMTWALVTRGEDSDEPSGQWTAEQDWAYEEEPPPAGPSLSEQDAAFGQDLIAAGILEDQWATEKMAYEARRVCDLLGRTPPPAGVTLEYYMRDAEEAATFARLCVQHYCPEHSGQLEDLIAADRVVSFR